MHKLSECLMYIAQCSYSQLYSSEHVEDIAIQASHSSVLIACMHIATCYSYLISAALKMAIYSYTFILLAS